MRAIFLIGSRRERGAFVHHWSMNFAAQAGETYSQKSWNSSFNRYARMVRRLQVSNSSSLMACPAVNATKSTTNRSEGGGLRSTAIDRRVSTELVR